MSATQTANEQAKKARKRAQRLAQRRDALLGILRADVAKMREIIHKKVESK